MRFTFRKGSPRDFIPCLGVVIFLLMIVTAFTGYVLPWDQMSFWGAKVITSLASKLGSRIISFLLIKMGCSGLIAFVIGLVIAFVIGRAPFSEDLGMRNVLPSREFSGDSWIEETFGNGEEASSSDVPTTSKNKNNEILELSQDDLWNNLEQPLLEEAERKDQLRNKLFSSLGHNPNIDFNKFDQDVQTHVRVEIVLEKALRVEGYLASDLNNSVSVVKYAT